MKKSSLVWVGSALGMGFSVAVSVYLGLKLGIWLDLQLDSAPFFLLFGTLVGLLAPIYGVFCKLFGDTKDS